MSSLLERLDAGGTVQIATFRLDQEWYGLDVLGMQEIMRPIAVGPVPTAPEHIRGLINVRGVIVTCLSPKHLLGCSGRDYGPGHRFVIVRDPLDDKPVCLLVDEVGDVLNLSPEQVSEAPPSAIAS
jgi:purine-binding chemotaxis protein CheW